MPLIRRMIILAVVLLWACPAAGAETDLGRWVAEATAIAQGQLGPLDRAERTACLCNAGYARGRWGDTRPVLDLLGRHCAISPGRGNLLVRPGRPQDTFFLMFLKKTDDDRLMMTYIPDRGGRPAAGPAMDITIKEETSFKPFEEVLGRQAFNLVTLANGWALGPPPDLLRGALRHGHLCCGVFTGYFTARSIEQRLPPKPGENYIYIGAPAWCQDDYILDYLRLTPGTHGYLTMSYPWWRPWKTAQGVFPNLGGVIVRWDAAAKKGRACLLAFNWRNDEFRAFLGRPDLRLDWGGSPWLHHAYNRFFMTRLDHPETFVSVLREKDLPDQASLDRLTRMGANPLAEILGPDPDWTAGP